MKIEITSASHKKESVEDVAAAVFVLTHDDIRHSGATTLPDALRLIPGVSVAQLSSSTWAISIRGFNSQLSNKLMVLVDGRTISYATVMFNSSTRGSAARAQTHDDHLVTSGVTLMAVCTSDTKRGVRYPKE